MLSCFPLRVNSAFPGWNLLCNRQDPPFPVAVWRTGLLHRGMMINLPRWHSWASVKVLALHSLHHLLRSHRVTFYNSSLGVPVPYIPHWGGSGNGLIWLNIHGIPSKTVSITRVKAAIFSQRLRDIRNSAGSSHRTYSLTLMRTFSTRTLFFT